MDIHEFDTMSTSDQWEYFWENGSFVDSIRTKEIDYFLYRDAVNKDFYMELWMERFEEGERGIKGLAESETVRYKVPHEKADLPWD